MSKISIKHQFNKTFVLLLSFYCSLSSAQPAPPPKAKQAAPANATTSTSAVQLIEITGINQIINGAIKSGSRLFDQAAKESSNIETRKRIEAAHKQFSNSQFEKELQTDIQNKLTKQFSEAELKYLTQLFNSPTAKKFKSFMSSPDIQAIHTKSYDRAKNLLAQAQKTRAKSPVK